MRQTPRSRRGARHAPVWGLLAFLLLPCTSVSAANIFSGDYSTPGGASFDGGADDRAAALTIDASTNVYVVGKSSQGANGYDWVLIKYDSNGIKLASATFHDGGVGPASSDEPYDIIAFTNTIIVVGRDGQTNRRARAYNPSLGFLGQYAEAGSNGGVFTGVTGDGTSGTYMASVRGGTLFVNHLNGSFVMDSTGTVAGSYSEFNQRRNVVRDASGNVYVAGIDAAAKKLVVAKFNSLLVLQSSVAVANQQYYMGVTLGIASNDDVYATAVSTGGSFTNTALFRLSTSLVQLASTTIVANSSTTSTSDERSISFHPSNGNVYVIGSGPFPGTQICDKLTLACSQASGGGFPSNSLFIINSTRAYATQVNTSQDIVSVAFDPTVNLGGGGNAGQPALTNDGTSLYLSKKAGNGMVDLYKISPPSTLVASGTLSGVGANDNFPLLYKGGFLYMVGTASGATTRGDDAAVWKINPANLLMVSSRTLDGSAGLGEFVMDATTTANGLVLSGALETSPGTFSVALWQYDTGTDALVLKATANAPSSSFDFASGVASTGTAGTLWLVGYSSQPVGGSVNPLDVALWRYNGAALQLVNTLPAFVPGAEDNPKITATSGGLFVTASKVNSVPDRDLAFIAYDLAGGTTVEKYWHSSSPSTHDKSAGLLVNDAGSVVVFGGQEPSPSTGFSAYWDYSPAGVLTSGYPKTFTNAAVFYAGTKLAGTIWAANSGASTVTFALNGTGAAVPGAEGLVGAPASALTFSFLGGPATSLKINSNANQNEVATFVAVDTTSAVFYLVWRSTSGPAFSTPDAAFLGKFDFSGTLLASTALQGSVSGDAFLFAYGSLWLQEKDTATLRQYTKFDAGLNRLGSLVLNSNDVGNITNAVAANAVIYLACDGGSGANGGAKLIKVNTGLAEVARSTNAEYGPVHHNADGFMADAAGNLLVAVSTSEPGPARSLFKYDANLAVLSSANVTGLFPNKSPQLAYGGAGVVYALGENAPTAQMFLRRFDSGLGYSGQTATITVTGAAPFGQLTTDPDRNALVALTTSSADGGDVLAFKFNNALVQLSSGQFDAGFNGADSGLAAVALSTAEVFLSAAGGNAGHTDAVVMRRRLSGAAAGGAGGATRIWAGPGFGNASAGSNWVGGVAPTVGDYVVFGDTSALNSCTWDLAIALASVTVTGSFKAGVDFSSAVVVNGPFEMLGSTNAIVRFIDAPANVHALNGPVTVGSGTFHIGQTTVVAVGSITVNSGGVAEMHDQALFKGSEIHVMPGAGRLRLYDVGAFPGGPTLTSTGTAPGAVLRVIIDGTADISSATFLRLSIAGLQLGATVNIVSLSSVTFAGPQPSGSAAISFGLPGSVAVATMTNVTFADAAIGVNVNAANLAGASQITMAGAKGLRAGPAFENDPGGKIAWLGFGGAAGSTVTLAFSGSFLTGARAFNDVAGADIGHRLAVMSVGLSTFVYATVHSTSSAAPGNPPDQVFLAKYDLTGVMLASAALLGNSSGDVLVAEGGFVYASEKDAFPGTMRRLVRHDANLNRLNTVAVDADGVGNITGGFARAGFLYTVNDGGNLSPGAKLIKYDAALNEVARATYSIGAAHVNGNAIVVTPVGGEVFVSVTSSPTAKLVKYDANLVALAEKDVTGLFPGAMNELELAFANGVLLAASFDPAGTKVLVRKFDPALAYSGASSTFSVQTAPAFGLKSGPDGLFYVALTSYSVDGGDYALKVLDAGLVERASASFDAGFAGFDQAVGIAVLDSSNVFVTGAGLNLGQYDAMTFVKNLSAGGGGAAGGGPGGFSAAAAKDGRLWAVQRGLGVARRYDFPAPPVSRTSPFSQELGAANGVLRPTALAVDGGGGLWVSASTAPGAGQNTRLVRFASAGSLGEAAPSSSTVLSSLLVDVRALALRPDTGDLWAAQGGAEPSIVTFLRDGASTLSTPTYSNAGASTFTTAAQLPDASALAFDTGGNLWVAARALGQVRMYPKLAGSISPSTAQVITAVAGPSALAFDAAGHLYVGEAGVTPFSGRLWKFANLGSAAAPSISNGPVLVQSGVDPAALAFIAGQLWGASDLDDQIVLHPTAPPAPPPQFGRIRGALSYGGLRPGQIMVAVSTNPADVDSSAAATVIQATAAFGSYELASLQAPNTYYARAVRAANPARPQQGFDPFARYSTAAFFGPLTPIYVAPDQTVSGIDMTLYDLAAVTGTITNNSAQSGLVRVEPWFGAPGALGPGAQLAFGEPAAGLSYAVYSATITNLTVRAFVDSNFNGRYDSGEDFGAAGPLNLSAVAPLTTTFANITIGASPAGQLFLATASVVGPNIPTNGEAAFLKLGLWSAGGNVQLSGLRVTLKGDAPAPSVFAQIYKDGNGNGTFESGADFVLGGAPFSGSVPPKAAVTFFSTETVSAATQTYFVGLRFFGLPAGKSAGAALDSASAFTFANGSLAAAQGPFPVESALAVTQFSLAARPLDQGYPVPQGGAAPSGGFDTGLFVNTGQRLQVNAAGLWNTGALGPSGPDGLAQASTAAPAGGVNLGALIGRIGGSAWFRIGASTNFVSGVSGPLALAMNDADYNDNSASLAVDFRIVPSSVTRFWLGNSGFGQNADIAQNWQGGQVPQAGESVEFNGAVSTAPCDWNLYFANVGRLELKNGYSGTVRLKGSINPDDFNQVFVGSNVLVLSGTLDLGRNHEVFVNGGVTVRGVLDMGGGNSGLGVGQGVSVAQGGAFRFTGAGFPRVFSTGFGSLAFQVLDATVEVRGTGIGAGLRFERPENVLLSASANILAFDGAQFDQFDPAGSASALSIARSTAGVYVFRNLGFAGSLTKNIDAAGAVPGNSITVLDAIGTRRGTPYENDPNGVVNWVPDGGGAPASISGSVLNGGVSVGFSSSTVRVSTQPFFDPSAPQGGFSLQTSVPGGLGAYTLSNLDAPATYFLYAWGERGTPGIPDGNQEPRGAYGNAGLFRSAPLFVAPGQNLTGADISLKDWGELQADISNASQQFGTILLGAARVNSTTTLESIGFPQGPGFSAFLPAPATSVMLIAWVDVNNDRKLDGFEARGSSVVSLQAGSLVRSSIPVVIGGGSAPPGGAVGLAPSIPHGGLVGDVPPQAMMKLVLSGAGGASRLNGVRVDIAGGPQQNYGLSAWVDGNGNGKLDPQCSSAACDFSIGSAFVAPPISSAVVNFYQPLDLASGQTRTLFVAFEPFSLSAGHPALPPVGLSIAASNYFLMGAGSMNADPVYPVVSNAQIGWSVMAQTQGDSFGGGGYFTGVPVAAGQTVTVTATGTWRFNGADTDFRGFPNTESQPTLVQGSRVGAVLASVGNGWVAVGTGVTITARFPTTVHLSANDVPGDYFNNEGYVTANIGVSGSTTSRVEGVITYTGGQTGNLFVNLIQDCQFAPTGCRPVLSTQTLTLAGGTTQYSYGLHIPFGGFFTVRAVVANDPSHRSGFIPNFQAPMGSTYTLNFPVFAGLGQITSTIAYGGVMNFGEFRVGVTTTPDLEHGAEFFGGFKGPNAGPIVIANLPIPNTYYIVGFRDGNFNQNPDGPEPFGGLTAVPSSQVSFADLASLLVPVFVSSTAHVGPIVMTDRGGVSGRLFFQQAVASGQAVILAAHGLPGSAGFAPESRDFRFVQNVPANGSVDYFLDLLKPATDYTLFAFLDQNFNANYDAGEPFATTNGFLTVPSGGFTNRDLAIGAPAAPPAVTGFGIVSFGTGFVEFRWDSAPGATGYLLLDASSATVASLGAAATVYNEAMTPASTSAVTGIRAGNAQGLGPVVRLPAGRIGAALADPVAAPVLSNVQVSSLTVTWTAGTNGSLAIYQLERASAASGPYAPIQFGPALSKNEIGMAPSTQYFYRVKAQSPNGAFSAPSATASATTGASSDSNVHGIVQYDGKQDGALVVQLFVSSNPLSGLTGSVTLPPSALQPYYIPAAAGPYFRRAFVDVNGNGLREPGEDQSPISLVTAAVASGFSNFVLNVDTVTPASPAGVRIVSPFGRVDLSWNPPATNSDGTSLNDLAGFKVQRTTAGTANFVTLTTATVSGVPSLTASASFSDLSPVAGGVDNVYRVVAVDFGRNESIPSGAVAIRPALGGTISGSVSSFTATTAGAFRVRLSTSPRREDPFYAESTLLNFSFTGLADGVYYLRVFRDVNADNQQDAATEPSGTHGGIIAPFPISITGGNTVSGRVVTACDRTALTPGQDSTGTLHASACPAADKGQGFFTKLHTFRVGGGAANSIGVGSSVDVSLVTPGFDSELIVLGPDGQVVARDNTPGNPHARFPASQAGLYVVEPTSFYAENFAARSGFFDLLLNVVGGFNGTVAGRTSYTGARPGQIQLQLFDRPDADAFPFFIQTQASTGAFSFANLRDGTFYLRAFRDSNGNFAVDPGEPVGAYGASVSSPTAIKVVGGVASAASADVVLADPSTGRIEGQILRQGSLSGTIRIEVGPRACGDCSDLDVVAFTTIAAAGPYALDFIAPATTYVVQAFVDGNANNSGDALEAKGSSSPVTVAANSTSTVNVLVRDPGTGTSGTSVVFGTVAYTGASTGTVFIAFASDQNFNFIPYYLTNSATGFFRKSGLQGGTTYYVGAFIDVNNNGTIDEDGALVEPVGDFNGQLFVPNSSSVGVAFSIPDPSNGRVSGVVTYNGTVSGPLVVEAELESTAPNGGRGGFRAVSIPRTAGVSSYSYTAGFLDAGAFRMFAFVDSNANQRPDFGEPFFWRETLVSVSSGSGGAPVAGINLRVFDAGAGGGAGAVGSIAGTFNYGGTQPGPVVVQLYSTNTFLGAPLQTTNASGGPNSFSFSFNNLVPGGYFVRAFKDANFNQFLEPQFEANGLLAGGSALTVSNDNPFSGGHVGALLDPGVGGGGGGASLSGTVDYRGSFATGTFHLALFQDLNGDGFANELLRRTTFPFSASPFNFTFSGLPTGQVYLRGFLDRNDSFSPDASEPFGLTDAQGISVFGAESGLIISICDRTPLNMTPGAQNLFTLNASSCFSRESETLGASQKLLTFRGTRGQTFDATAASSEDNYLYLYDQNGQLVAQADEGGAKQGDARLVARLPTSGDYTLAAGFFAAGVAGDMTVTVQNSGGAPGSISGEVRYTGSQGGRIQTAVFNSPNFDAAGSFVDARELAGPGAFSFSGLASETSYYLGAFVDVNGNRHPDAGEDFGVFSTAPPTASPVFLRSGQDLSGVLLEIAPSTAAFAGNEGHVTGQITYAGSVPQGAVLRVEFWADATFDGGGAPLAVRFIPTGVGPYDLSIKGGQPYYVRAFLDFNADYVPSPNEPQGVYDPHGQGAEPVYVPTNATASGIDFDLRDPGLKAGQTEPSGEGSLSFAPTTIADGATLDRVTFTFVAAGAGIRQGGFVAIGLPPGFPFPQNASGGDHGYVSTVAVTNPAGAAPTIQLAFPAGVPAFEAHVLSSTPLYAGATVQFAYGPVFVPCGAPDLSFFAGSASTGTVPLSPLFTTVPEVTRSLGAAASVRTLDNQVGLLAGTTSQRLALEAINACGSRVAVSAAANVILRAVVFDPNTGTPVPTTGVRVSSTITGVFDSTAVVRFAAGTSTAIFRLRGVSAGDYFLEQASNLLGTGSTGYMFVSVLPNNTLTDVSVATRPFIVGRTSATIIPNGDPTGPNQAFINFTMGDPTRSWSVSIASTPFKQDVTPSPVAFFSGNGQPAQGLIAWDGRGQDGLRQPRGVYYVRVEVGGLTDDSLRVTIEASELKLRAVDAGVTPNLPLAAVRAEIYGPGGSNLLATDADGDVTFSGLAAGVYRLGLNKEGYLRTLANVTLSTFSTVTGFTALSPTLTTTTVDGRTVLNMGRAPSLVVVPSIPVVSTSAGTLYGQLQVFSTTANFTKNGPMRLPAGTTTFDDGGQYDPSLGAYVAKTILRFSVASNTYTVRATLPGFDELSSDVFVAPTGQTTLTLPAFSRRSAFLGRLFLPAGFNTAGTFVSVSAVPITTTTALDSGGTGVSIAAGVDTATYRIDGLKAGSYRLRANLQGLQAVEIASATVFANQDTAVDFSSFPVANTSVLVATVNISGIAGSFPEIEPGVRLRLNLSALRPGAANSFSQSVAVSTLSASTTVVFNMTGLDAGVPYRIYAGLESRGDAEFEAAGGFEKSATISTTTGRGAVAFDFAAASGIIRGVIYLPAGATDFANVNLDGETITSVKPDQVGHKFSENALTLPGFVCGNGAAPAAGACPAGVNSASFTVTGLNTESLDVTFSYGTTGAAQKLRVSVVNGSTTTVAADLRPTTFRVVGAMTFSAVQNSAFDTAPEAVANAALVPIVGASGRVVVDTATVDLGGAGSVDSLARVVLLRDPVSAGRVFNPATDRVGYLTAGGSFTVRNVPAGAYTYVAEALRSCATCAVSVFAESGRVTVVDRDVRISTFTRGSGVYFFANYRFAGNVADIAQFRASVYDSKRVLLASATWRIGNQAANLPSNVDSDGFRGLPPTDVTLVLEDISGTPKYVSAPLAVKLVAPGVVRDVTLHQGAFVAGKLKDAATGEVFTGRNARVLPPNLRVTATANPWVEGGFSQAASSVAGRPIQADGTFVVGPLLTGIAYDLAVFQDKWDLAFFAQGAQNYVPVKIGGLNMTSGERRNVGTLSLNSGDAVTGTIVDAASTTTALGNIKVTAKPSFGEVTLNVETFTDGRGAFKLWVSTFVSPQYDLTFAPIEGNQAADGRRFKTLQLAKYKVSADPLSVRLEALSAPVTGQVLTVDGGALAFPFGDGAGAQAAAVFFQKANTLPKDNPLGDLSVQTEPDGRFSAASLSTGVYSVRAVSLGYGVASATLTLTNTGFCISTTTNLGACGAITLKRGGLLQGSIKLADGTNPSSDELGGVTAANADFSKTVQGSLVIDKARRVVTGYSITGFEPGVSYDVTLLPVSREDSDVIAPDEGQGISFAATESTTTKTVNLTYKRVVPDCQATAVEKAVGNGQFQVKITCTKPLRSGSTGDDDVDSILSVSSCVVSGSVKTTNLAANCGSILGGASKKIESSRKVITAVYRSGNVNEESFTLKLKATMATVDPATGDNFALTKLFTFDTIFRAGTTGTAALPQATTSEEDRVVVSNAQQEIPNARGGEVKLEGSERDADGEQFALNFQAGSFKECGAGDSDPNCSNGAAAATAKNKVGVTVKGSLSASDAANRTAATLGYVPSRIQAMLAREGSFGVQASSSAKNAFGKSPLSTFYDIFLPLGVRSQLTKAVDLTMPYDLSGQPTASISDLQIWSKSQGNIGKAGCTGQYCPENKNLRVDTINKTVTVSVDHFSQFVVLNGPPALKGAGTFVEQKPIAFNFPNPFDCRTRTISCNVAEGSCGAAASITGVGTVIHYAAPGPVVSLDHRFRIYNVAGELVDEFHKTADGGTHNYDFWDCTNSSGRPVASGVYILEYTVNGQSVYHKMAVIKGSGL